MCAHIVREGDFVGEILLPDAECEDFPQGFGVRSIDGSTDTPLPRERVFDEERNVRDDIASVLDRYGFLEAFVDVSDEAKGEYNSWNKVPNASFFQCWHCDTENGYYGIYYPKQEGKRMWKTAVIPRREAEPKLSDTLWSILYPPVVQKKKKRVRSFLERLFSAVPEKTYKPSRDTFNYSGQVWTLGGSREWLEKFLVTNTLVTEMMKERNAFHSVLWNDQYNKILLTSNKVFHDRDLVGIESDEIGGGGDLYYNRFD